MASVGARGTPFVVDAPVPVLIRIHPVPPSPPTVGRRVTCFVVDRGRALVRHLEAKGSEMLDLVDVSTQAGMRGVSPPEAGRIRDAFPSISNGAQRDSKPGHAAASRRGVAEERHRRAADRRAVRGVAGGTSLALDGRALITGSAAPVAVFGN